MTVFGGVAKCGRADPTVRAEGVGGGRIQRFPYVLCNAVSAEGLRLILVDVVSSN